VATRPNDNNSQSSPTTGHEWDGIREFDNPLPRWWLWVLYACIAWSVVYWVAMPAWPLVSDYTRGILGYSQRLTLAEEMKAAEATQAGFRTKISTKSFEEIRKDPELLEFAIAGGRSAYAVNCSQCHGSGAAGFRGYPNLNDDAWLWGGTVEAIHQTIRYGIRSGHPDERNNAMPAFLKDELLSASQIDDVTEYVLTLSNQPSDAAAARRGAKIFAEQCVSCHSKTGKGNTEFGAPDLTDAIWLYGGDKATISETIAYSRNGVMPSWETRLDPVTLKKLAVFVHSLGGGK
jgi:cytochrome c oxidase cbb3-type subunit 3